MQEKEVRKYLSKIGTKGGKKSKRTLTSEQAREMVKVRDNRKQVEELKKEWNKMMDYFDYPEYGIAMEDDRQIIWNWFLSHAKELGGLV